MTFSGLGKASYHDTRESPILLVQGDGDLTDSSGNGYDLAVDVGTENYATLLPGLQGLGMDGSTAYEFASAGSNADFRITGEITIAFIALVVRIDSAESLFLNMTGTTESEADNGLYALTSTSSQRLQYSFETGTGTNNLDPIEYIAPYGRPFHWVFIRESDGDVSHFLDGALVSQTAPGSPTGGTNTFFSVGANIGGASAMRGGIASLQICDFAWSPAQAQEAYNYTLGPVFGHV